MELYNKATESLSRLFADSLSGSVNWKQIPGQLARVSASPAGYTWGVNQLNDVYVCKEPCAGNWAFVQRPDSARVLDITTDTQFVYVLVFGKGILRKKVDNTGDWSQPIAAPDGATRLGATANDLFADTPSGTYRCKMPCNLPSWVAATSQMANLQGTMGGLSATLTGSSAGGGTATLKGKGETVLKAFFSPTDTKMTSASSKKAYGVRGGTAVSYENGEWKPIKGLVDYTVTQVAGEYDDQVIYAITESAEVLRCAAPCRSPDDVSKVGADGKSPDPAQEKSISMSAFTKNLWMLSSEGSGLGGKGVLLKEDAPKTDLAKAAASLDAQRDTIVQDLENRQKSLEYAATVGKQLEDTTTYAKGIKFRTPPEKDPAILRRNIQIDAQPASLLLLQIALATVFAVLLAELVLPEMVAHGVAFLIACIGIAAAVSFSG